MKLIDINNTQEIINLAKSLKNSAKVGVKEGSFVIIFSNPIKIDGEDIKEFIVKKPTTMQVEMALEGLDIEKDSFKMLKRLLSATISVTISPKDIGNVFAIEEIKAFEKVLTPFLD